MLMYLYPRLGVFKYSKISKPRIVTIRHCYVSRSALANEKRVETQDAYYSNTRILEQSKLLKWNTRIRNAQILDILNSKNAQIFTKYENTLLL